LAAHRTDLANFAQTDRIAAVTIDAISVVASFGRFEHTIATTRSHTNVGVVEQVAELSIGTIRILIASTRVVRRIAELARALRRHHTRLAEFTETNRIASVAIGVVSVFASFASFENEVAAARIDARIGIRDEIAEFAHWTIRILIADANEARQITGSTRAFAREQARLPEFLQTRRIAAVTVVGVAVFTSFTSFQDVVTTARINANVGICDRIAKLAHGTIDALVASTGVIRRIAEAAGALTRKRTRNADFTETEAIASVAAHRIAIVTSFGHFDDAIATARIDANIRVGRRVAKLDARTIREFVASTDVARWIAERTGTNVIVTRTRLSEFLQTLRIATVTIVQVVVIATFTHFEHAVAATCRYALVRVERQIALLTARTIAVFVACTNVARRIAERARTC